MPSSRAKTDLRVCPACAVHAPAFRELQGVGPGACPRAGGIACARFWLLIGRLQDSSTAAEAPTLALLIVVVAFFSFLEEGRGWVGDCAHLSTLITHRVMMEAVQHITSMPMKMLQNTSPKSHLPPVRSVTITKGMTTMATDRSATARDTSR